jgi:plastocyanin
MTQKEVTAMRHDDIASGPDVSKPLFNRRALLGFGAAALVGTGAITTAGADIFAQDSTPGAGDAASDACATPGASQAAMASPAASPAADACPAGPVVHTVDIAFEPKELTIPANTDVVVTIENKGQLEHNFAIDELDVESDLLGNGETTTVTINAAPGTYTYYCSVTGHREAGMEGTLTVE